MMKLENVYLKGRTPFILVKVYGWVLLNSMLNMERC